MVVNKKTQTNTPIHIIYPFLQEYIEKQRTTPSASSGQFGSPAQLNQFQNDHTSNIHNPFGPVNPAGTPFSVPVGYDVTKNLGTHNNSTSYPLPIHTQTSVSSNATTPNDTQNKLTEEERMDERPGGGTNYTQKIRRKNKKSNKKTKKQKNKKKQKKTKKTFSFY